jgi:anti-sigma regulatory factor (Ser/Thr protein kinase)
MADSRASTPASLQVYRYRQSDGSVQAIIGEVERSLPQDELAAHAHEALSRDTFMCYAVSQANDFVGDEICFIPQGDRCEILSIRTNGWQRHHGDHRRSLVEILNNIAAAVACGKLRVLDRREMEADSAIGEPILELSINDSASLASARDAVAEALTSARLADDVRQRTVLCLSEAVTNMLLHGGGSGRLTLRRTPGLLRFVVADQGPGLNFLNWIEPPAKGGQASMGYGFKIIVDNLDAVGLYTAPTGTTLLLDRKTD